MRAAFPSETTEYYLEQPSEKNCASAAKYKIVRSWLCMYRKALEHESRQHIWRGGMLPPG
jgi:hypothetical protein